MPGAEAKSKRFGVIEFAVGVDVTPEFKHAVKGVAEADWRPLPREAGARSKSMPRFVMFLGWWGTRSMGRHIGTLRFVSP